MAINPGVDPQVLTLPNGGGAVQDMGSTFNADLNTGSGSFGLNIDTPAGANGVRPQLKLSYQTGSGNGVFGIGWSMGELCIARQCDKGLPTYLPGDDHFLIPGVDDLVDMGAGTFRPRVDTTFFRIRRNGAGWEVTDTKGTVHILGSSAGAQVTDGASRTGRWLLETSMDAGSDPVSYEYQADGFNRLLSSIRWGSYSLQFIYDGRPDRLIDGSFGFIVPTNKRCIRIELHAEGQTAPLIRSWNFSYTQAPGAGISLLSSITMRGHAADGATLNASTVTLTYTQPAASVLQRVAGPFPGATPAPFSGGTVELVDWNGDGLPDVFELNNGVARVWPNLGRNNFGYPRSVPALPGPVNLNEPGLAFADMDGNGVVDLFKLVGSVSFYTPISPGGGFGQPVYLQRCPTATLASKKARFVDLDGDGIPDLLSADQDYFSLYYRQTDGWSETPQVVPAALAPPVSFSDGRTRLADMNGDGLQDLVRVDGGGIRYWPYLGYGRWGAAIYLHNPPVLPLDFDPSRLFIADVDGDGCSDFVYVDNGRVTLWHNQGGCSIADPVVHDFLPFATPDQIRLCDFNGAGTMGVLYSDVPSGPTSKGYFYFDLSGGVKPYLLTKIDNGLGLTTYIGYRSSTEYSLDAAAAGKPWKTFHPYPVQCVASINTSDTASGETGRVDYLYHECRYNSTLRAFSEFRVVETFNAGDTSIPAQRLVTTYHLGLDPADLNRPLFGDDILLFGALRRRLLTTEVYAQDSSPDQSKPYRITTHTYASKLVAGVNGNKIAIGYETQTVDEDYQRTGAPIFTKTVDYLNYDQYGNITQQRQRAGRTGQTSYDQDITTNIAFAQNPSKYVVSMPARVTQQVTGGATISTKIMTYDGPANVGLPEGQVDTGFLTRVEVLVLTDELVTSTYGAWAPDFTMLGYHRRGGEDGWWTYTVSYARTAGPPYTLKTTNAKGAVSIIEYDATRQYVIKLTDPLNHVTTAVPDLRALVVSSLTDPNGNTITERFDALGRVVKKIGKLDSDALPSVSYVYATGSAPFSATAKTLINHGQPKTLDQTTYYDGKGRSLCAVVPAGSLLGSNFIVSGRTKLNARGLIAAQYGPFLSNDNAFHAPAPSIPISTSSYDGLGRVLQRTDSSKTRTTFFYGPDFTTVMSDKVGGTLARAMTQRHDSLNRVTSVERPFQGRTVRATYEYNAFNNIVVVHDAGSGLSTFVFDLLGRIIRQATPDTGTTLFVIDASGNQIERIVASGATQRFTLDALDRVLTETTDGAATPFVAYTYLNPGDTLPADGEANRYGRVWKIDDQLGTLTHAYDELGHVIKTTRTVAKLGRTFVTDFLLDAVGRQVSVTLPEAEPGAGRRVVPYSYDARGLLTASPGYVKSAVYDLNGRMTDWTMQTGVSTHVDFFPSTTRIQRVVIKAADGSTVLRDQFYSYDDADNILKIDSQIAQEAGVFTYDAFDRLLTATYGNGDNFDYAYDDAGNITNIKELGACAVRAPGSSQMVTAGPNGYTYDTDGRMKTAPYGALDFDAGNRLNGISFTDGSQESYLYDHNNNRVYRKDAAGKESYVITPSFEIIDGAPLLWISFGNRKLMSFVNGSISCPHYDLFGSPTLFTDASGNEMRRLAFGPYGTLRADSAASPPPDGVRYAGVPLDDKSGLICLGVRYYDPRIGRFLSVDIVASPFALDGWNGYIYARCNPLRFVDPTGMSIWDVLAIIAVAIVVAVLIVAACFTGGATLPFAFGLCVSVQGLLVTTAIGVAGGAIIGGIAAYQAGGSIAEGVLFGGFVGGVSAFVGGYLSSGVFLGLGGTSLTGVAAMGANALAGAIQGAIAGAGTGAAVGFAGGKGSITEVLKHMAMGFATGAVTGALLGFFFGGFKATVTNPDGSTSGGELQIGSLGKYTNLGNWSGGQSIVNNLDTEGSTMQDFMNWAGHGTGALPNGITDFIYSNADGPQTFGTIFSSANNSALITIPMGWVPSVFVPYGGAVFLNAASMVLDQTGVQTWDQQFLFILNAIPLVGIAVGYGVGEGTSIEDNATNWIKKNFSQQLASS